MTLIRKTPMRRSSSPMPRSSWRRQPRSIPAVPQARTGPDTATRSVVAARAGGRCEVCNLPLDAVAASVHHRRPRGMGGTSDPAINSPANLLLVCGTGTTGCHGDIEANRARSIIRGHLVPQHQDPATIPVQLHHDRTALLTHDGTYADLEET